MGIFISYIFKINEQMNRQGVELNNISNRNQQLITNDVVDLVPLKLDRKDIPCWVRFCFHFYKFYQYALFILAIVYLCVLRSFENDTNRLQDTSKFMCLNIYYIVSGIDYCIMMFGVANFF